MKVCDYCGEAIGHQLVCQVCGGEFCPNEGCLMPAGAGVPCLACKEGSPCDVEEDDDIEPDWGGSWGDQL